MKVPISALFLLVMSVEANAKACFCYGYDFNQSTKTCETNVGLEVEADSLGTCHGQNIVIKACAEAGMYTSRYRAKKACRIKNGQ